MSIKKNILYLALITLVITASNEAFATILRNGSVWNIKYKFGKPESRVYSANDEMLLEAGQEISFDIYQPISIRRSGKASNWVSGWTEVPVSPSLSGSDDEVIEIGGMSATGWTFSTYKIR